VEDPDDDDGDGDEACGVEVASGDDADDDGVVRTLVVVEVDRWGGIFLVCSSSGRGSTRCLY